MVPWINQFHLACCRIQKLHVYHYMRCCLRSLHKITLLLTSSTFYPNWVIPANYLLNWKPLRHLIFIGIYNIFHLCKWTKLVTLFFISQSNFFFQIQSFERIVRNGRSTKCPSPIKFLHWKFQRKEWYDQDQAQNSLLEPTRTSTTCGFVRWRHMHHWKYNCRIDQWSQWYQRYGRWRFHGNYHTRYTPRYLPIRNLDKTIEIISLFCFGVKLPIMIPFPSVENRDWKLIGGLLAGNWVA